MQEGKGTEGLEKGEKLLETLVQMWFTWENLSVVVVFNFHLAFSSFTRCRRPSIYWGRKSLKVAAKCPKSPKIFRKWHQWKPWTGRKPNPNSRGFGAAVCTSRASPRNPACLLHHPPDIFGGKQLPSRLLSGSSVEK